MCPASFRVIGVGSGIDDVIDSVKSLELVNVSTEVVNNPVECAPTEFDKLAIFVSTGSDEVSNGIAKTFHDSGVLTIGLNENANPACYDSIIKLFGDIEKLEIIKSILLPITIDGILSFDFVDLSQLLRASGHFTVGYASGKNFRQVVAKLWSILDGFDSRYVERLSFNVFYNLGRSGPITMSDIIVLKELFLMPQASTEVVWSVHYDDKLNDDIKIYALIVGRDLRRKL